MAGDPREPCAAHTLSLRAGPLSSERSTHVFMCKSQFHPRKTHKSQSQFTPPLICPTRLQTNESNKTETKETTSVCVVSYGIDSGDHHTARVFACQKRVGKYNAIVLIWYLLSHVSKRVTRKLTGLWTDGERSDQTREIGVCGIWCGTLAQVRTFLHTRARSRKWEIWVHSFVSEP